MREVTLFNEVFYNVHLDIEYGVDIVINVHDHNYGLNLFVKTRAAQSAREKKAHRHKVDVGFPCFDLSIDMADCTKCGKFFLYSHKIYSGIINHILSL